MSAYISALERQDIKNYPLEIAKIPQRDLDRTTPSVRGRSYADIAASVEKSYADEAEKNAGRPELPAKNSGKPFSLWEGKDFHWGDIVDIINPLHHIPIVSAFYRSMTTDKIGVVPRLIGGALYGRIVGFVAAVVNAIVDVVTGRDIGEHLYAAIFGAPEKDQTDKVLAHAPETETMRLLKDSTEAQTETEPDPVPVPPQLSQVNGAIEEPASLSSIGPPTIQAVSAPTLLPSAQRILQHGDELGESKIDKASTSRSLQAEQVWNRSQSRDLRGSHPVLLDSGARPGKASMAALMKYEQAYALYALKPKRGVYLSA